MTPARHRALYRTLLALYPRQFRREYGALMTQVFADQIRDLGANAWVRTAPDLLRTVPSQRIEAVMNISSRARVVAFCMVMAVAAFLVVVGVGTGGPVVTVGIVALIAVVALPFGLRALDVRGERAPLRHALVQTWWAPVAGLLGLAGVGFGIGTVFEASNWGGRIFGSTLMLAFGGAILLGLMRRPFARQSGNALILIGTAPAFPFFWVVVPTVAAVVVWIGVLSSGFSDEAAAPATT